MKKRSHLSDHDSCFNIWQRPPGDPVLFLNEIMRYYHLLSMVPVSAGECLDAGCGTGYMSYLLRLKRRLDVTALDVNEKRLEIFKPHAKNIKIMHSDIMKLNKSESYDLIVSQEVLEHVPDYSAMLGKFRSLLKKPGHLLVCVPYKENLMAKMIVSPVGEKYHKNGHLHSFSMKRLENDLRRCGFKILNTRLIVNKRTKKWFSRISDDPEKFVPFLLIFDDFMNRHFPWKAAYLAILAGRVN